MSKKLYERDYINGFTDEEQKQIDDINQDENYPKFGYKNRKLMMIKAYRHQKSLFPNFYMDYADLKDEKLLTKEINDLENLLEKDEVTENELQRLIKDNRYWHIIASLVPELGARFGHHDLYLFPEFEIDTMYRSDYLLVGSGSGGYEFMFIELEGASHSATVKTGHFSSVLNKGINQVEDWKRYIEAHYSVVTAEFKKYLLNKQSPLREEFYEYDSTRFHYVVIAGRRKDFNEVTYRLKRENNIFILHYDNLLDFTRRLLERKSY